MPSVPPFRKGAANSHFAEKELSEETVVKKFLTTAIGARSTVKFAFTDFTPGLWGRCPHDCRGPLYSG